MYIKSGDPTPRCKRRRQDQGRPQARFQCTRGKDVVEGIVWGKDKRGRKATMDQVGGRVRTTGTDQTRGVDRAKQLGCPNGLSTQRTNEGQRADVAQPAVISALLVAKPSTWVSTTPQTGMTLIGTTRTVEPYRCIRVLPHRVTVVRSHVPLLPPHPDQLSRLGLLHNRISYLQQHRGRI